MYSRISTPSDPKKRVGQANLQKHPQSFFRVNLHSTRLSAHQHGTRSPALPLSSQLSLSHAPPRSPRLTAVLPRPHDRAPLVPSHRGANFSRIATIPSTIHWLAELSPTKRLTCWSATNRQIRRRRDLIRWLLGLMRRIWSLPGWTQGTSAEVRIESLDLEVHPIS